MLFSPETYFEGGISKYINSSEIAVLTNTEASTVNKLPWMLHLDVICRWDTDKGNIYDSAKILRHFTCHPNKHRH